MGGPLKPLAEVRINLLRVAKTHAWLAAYMEKQAAELSEGARILRETADRNRAQYEYKRHRVRWPNQKPIAMETP